MAKTIMQVIPAEGWLMVYKATNGKKYAHRLACWALVKDSELGIRVEGMNGVDYIDFCEDVDGFDGYAHERGFGEIPADYDGGVIPKP